MDNFKMGSNFRGIPAEKLTTMAGNGWQDFSFGRDGLFYLPGWRRGFAPDEIRAQFFQVQMVSHYKQQDAAMRRELESSIQDAQEAERLAGWYRQQLVLESRMGMALARIAG